MASVAIQIADAIADELNSEDRSWAGRFVAARRWIPVFDDTGDEADESVLQVSVVPVTRLGERQSRTQVPGDWGVVVDFRRLLNALTTTAMNGAVDDLIELVETVREFFEDNHHLAGLTTYQITDAQNPLIFDPDVLYESRKFLSEINLNVWGPK